MQLKVARSDLMKRYITKNAMMKGLGYKAVEAKEVKRELVLAINIEQEFEIAVPGVPAVARGTSAPEQAAALVQHQLAAIEMPSPRVEQGVGVLIEANPTDQSATAVAGLEQAAAAEQQPSAAEKQQVEPGAVNIPNPGVQDVSVENDCVSLAEQLQAGGIKDAFAAILDVTAALKEVRTIWKPGLLMSANGAYEVVCLKARPVAGGHTQGYSLSGGGVSYPAAEVLMLATLSAYPSQSCVPWKTLPPMLCGIVCC
jgi:hypothetical protein